MPEHSLDRIPDDARTYDLRKIFKSPAAVEELKKRGIPGAKYLDQFSRKDGEGTKNLVVFDDQIIKILRKYGLAGLLASPAALAALSAPATPEQ